MPEYFNNNQLVKTSVAPAIEVGENWREAATHYKDISQNQKTGYQISAVATLKHLQQIGSEDLDNLPEDMQVARILTRPATQLGDQKPLLLVGDMRDIYLVGKKEGNALVVSHIFCSDGTQQFIFNADTGASKPVRENELLRSAEVKDSALKLPLDKEGEIDASQDITALLATIDRHLPPKTPKLSEALKNVDHNSITPPSVGGQVTNAPGVRLP